MKTRPLPHPRLLSADRRRRIDRDTLPEIIQEMLLTDDFVGANARPRDRLRSSGARWKRRRRKGILKIDPVIAWLTLNREGMLQVDGEGFYEGDELIFEME
jgi:hypothetical protein